MEEKFVSVQIFSEQNIICPKVEPSCIESDHGIFFVGLINGTIKCYTTHQTLSNFNQIYEFNTIWSQIESIKYLPKLKRIVTVEKNEVQKVCRVYHLLWDEKRQITRIPTFTIPNNVELVSVCKQTNQILISNSGIVSLWKFKEENSPECILEIQTNWNLKIINIFEQYISYGSENDFRILKIKKNENNLVEIRFDKTTKDVAPSLCQNYETKQHEFDLLGESSIIDQKFKILNSEEVEGLVHVLHKHFKKVNQIISVHFLKCLNEREFYNSSVGLNCIVNSSKKGFVYDMLNLKLLNEFNLVNECISTEMNSIYLFSLTKEALEIYSILGTYGGCLLKLYPFIGLNSISATNSKVVLLSTFESKKKNSYNVYVLNLVHFIEAYEDVLQSAFSYKTSNEKIYEHLLQESHFMLRSKYVESLHLNSLSSKMEVENYFHLLKNSYNLVSVVEKDKEKASVYFANSNLPLEQVLKELQDENLLDYFKLVLKRQKKAYNKETGDLILTLYSKFLPEEISDLILTQNLIHFNVEHCISLLEKLEDKLEVDEFLLALLCLSVGNLVKSEEIFNKISHESLIGYFQKFHSLFKEDEEMEINLHNELLKQLVQEEDFKIVPSLGFFLRKKFPFVLLDVCLNQILSKKVSISLLKHGKYSNELLDVFYSFLILNKEKNTKISQELCNILISEMKNKNERNSKEKYSRYTFVNYRHTWLNQIQIETPNEALQNIEGFVCFLQNQKSMDIEVPNETIEEFFSLKLLNLKEFKDQIHLILEKQPNLLLEYSKEFCKNLNDWRVLLNEIQSEKVLNSVFLII
jgi:hypothetical protein